MKSEEIYVGQIVRVVERPPLWNDNDVANLVGKTGKVDSIFTICNTFANITMYNGEYIHVDIQYLEPAQSSRQIYASITITSPNKNCISMDLDSMESCTISQLRTKINAFLDSAEKVLGD